MRPGISVVWRRAACLAVVSVCLTLLGCETNSSSSSDPGPAAGTDASSGAVSGVKADTIKPPADKAKPNASLEGDRLGSASFAPANPNISQDPSPFRFAEIAKSAGIDFVHFSGMTTERHFPTANGSGLAIFDYDGDGKLDLYFATCTLLPLGKAEKGPNRLYKNLGNGKFKDVTEASGLGYRGFCHGIIVGDIDNDGDQDVFLCNYGGNALFLNNGNGTFTDISHKAGIDAPNWSSSGAFIDYDNDGDLDLYVSNYGEWKWPDDDHFCGDKEKNVRFYCSPRTIRTTKHLFYRNNGDLTFTNVIDEVLPSPKEGETGKPQARSDGHGFGVVTADVDGDGLFDIYVANDMNPNFLYLNQGDGTFKDVTEMSGAAFDERGQAQSGMGVDAEDINGDGLPELFVTNFQNEYNTLYENQGSGIFLDTTAFIGLAADSMPWVGWGCALADFDNDGWPDAFVANGHVDNNRHQLGQNVDYEEPPLLHRNVSVDRGSPPPPSKDAEGTRQAVSRRFKLSTRDVGPYFSSKHVARGAAFGDIDNDGDIDIVINHKDGEPAVLRNDTPNSNHWIRLKLVGTKSNRDALGARVELQTEGLTIFRQRKGGCSMESANDPRLLVGLGPAEEVTKLVVRWPSGEQTTLEHLKTNQEYEIVEGKTQQP
ncbi:MAG TPA: CRTAC1 family protein [Isosphaeraceae bacterium]|jgi:hypothetical protein|nr:CRTAC1 family protein [Isosphaeraceae bacterium]